MQLLAIILKYFEIQNTSNQSNSSFSKGILQILTPLNTPPNNQRKPISK